MQKFLFTYPLHTLTFILLLVIHSFISVGLLMLFSSGWTLLFLLMFVNIYFLLTVGSAIIVSIIILVKKKLFVKLPISLILLLFGTQFLTLLSLPADGGDSGGSQSGPLGIIGFPLFVGLVVIHLFIIYITLKSANSSLEVTTQEVKKSFFGLVSICMWLGTCLISTKILFISALTGRIVIPTIIISRTFIPGLSILVSNNNGIIIVSSFLLSIFIALVLTLFLIVILNFFWSISNNVYRFRWLIFVILLIILIVMEFVLLSKFNNVIYNERLEREIICLNEAKSFSDYNKCLARFIDSINFVYVGYEKQADKIISYCDQFSINMPEFIEPKSMEFVQCSGYTKRDLCKLTVAINLYYNINLESYPDFDTAEIARNQFMFTDHLKLCNNLGKIAEGTCRNTKKDLCLYYLSGSSTYLWYSDLPDNDNHCSYISNESLKRQCLMERCQNLYNRFPDKINNCIKEFVEN